MAETDRFPGETILETSDQGGSKAETQSDQGQFPGTPVTEVADRDRQLSGNESGIGFEDINRGLSESLGAPVSLANALLGVAGLDADVPIGGPQSIRNAMSSLGIPVASEPGNTVSERAVQGVGEAAGGLVTGGALAKGVSAATQAVPQASRTATSLLDDAFGSTARTAGTIATEGATGAVEGTLGLTAERLTGGSQTARAIGELLGGILGPTPQVVAARVGAPQASGLGRKIKTKLSKEARREAGRRQIGKVAEDPEASVQGLDEPNLSNVPPAEQTRDRGLIGARQQLTDQDPQLAGQVREQLERSATSAEDQARSNIGKAEVGATREFLSERRNRFVEQLDQEAKKAGRKAQERLENIQPSRNRRAAQEAVGEEIQQAAKRAENIVNRAFGRVPDNQQITTERTREEVRQIIEEARGNRATSVAEELPGFVRRIIGRTINEQGQLTGGTIKGQASIKELRDLRSKINSAKSQAADRSINPNIVNNLERIQNAILEDIGAEARNVQGEAGEALRQALDAARAKKQIFDEGAVARIRGARTTDTEISAQPQAPQTTGETLESLLSLSTGNKRPGRDVRNLDELFQALEFGDGTVSPEARKNIRDFAKAAFIQAAAPDGQIKPQQARLFIQNNKDVLDRIGLTEELQDAESAQRIADDVQARVNEELKLLDNPKRRAASTVLNAPVGEEIRAILRSSNPEVRAREIMEQTKADPEGLASEGVKSAFVDEVFSRALSGQVGERTRRNLPSGEKLRKTLNQPRIRAVARQVLDDDERKFLEQITKELEKIDLGRQTQRFPRTNVEDELQGFETLAQVIGAQAGGLVGATSAGGSLQLAQIGSGRLRQFVEQVGVDEARLVLREALVNDESGQQLRDALTRRLESEEDIKQAIGQINNGLARAIIGDFAAAQQAPIARLTEQATGTEEGQRTEEQVRKRFDTKREEVIPTVEDLR